jgi:transposase
MDNNDLTGLIEFIQKYKNDSYWRLARFANGLEMDIEAVKNTLIHPNISNGVTEGINSLIKSIKRVGGGKAKIDLLTAKMVIRHLKKPAREAGDVA